MDERFYTGIIEAISEGAAILAPDCKVTYYNQSFAHMFELDKGVEGLCFDKILDCFTVDPGTVAEIRNTLCERRQFSGEILCTRKSGRAAWYNLEIKPVFDDKGATNFVIIVRDVSQIKGAEARYSKMQREYQFIFDNVLAGIVIHDANAKIKFINRKAVEMLGVSYDTIIDKTVDGQEWGFLRPDGSPMPTNELPFYRAMAERATVRGIMLGRRHPRDGKIIWALSNAFLVTNDQDEVGSVLVSFSDVTRLVESEAEARVYRERFELAARATQDVIFEWNIETGEFFANEAFKNVYGYDPPVVMGTANLDARNAIEEHQHVVRDATLEAIASGKERYALEHRIRRADGSIGHIVIRAFVVRNHLGHAVRIIGTSTDIGHLTAALISLEESETRFRIIADTVSDVLWDHNIETGESWVTPDWDKRLGINVDEIEFERNAWMKQVNAADFDRLVSSYNHALKSGARTWDIEYQMVGADSEKIDVAVKASILRHPDGKAYRVLGNLRDVTGIKRQQEGYTRARALEAVGQLTGGVAHDFNNLLMIILGNAELLQMSSLPEASAKNVALISRAAESAATLTKRLLAFSGGMQFVASRISLAALLENMWPLLRAGLPESIALSRSIAANIWDVWIDGNSLEQAIVNLAMNARDAMPSGGHVTIACENVDVTDKSIAMNPRLNPGRYVILSVSDDGMGMSEDVVGKVFEPYFTTKEFGKGTGLGLSTVYGFAAQSGGGVTITSEEGFGTKVSLYLPAWQDVGPIPSGAMSNVVPEPAVEGNRILLVEDQPQVREHVEKALLSLGYDVAAVNDAGAALSLLNGGGAFDLLFTDIVMPGGMNGLELGQVARRIAPQMKVLYTSGYPAGANESLGMQGSGVEFLQKPYRIRELKEAIARALTS